MFGILLFHQSLRQCRLSVIFYFRIMVSNDRYVPGSNDLSFYFNLLKNCYGKDPGDVELNGKKIFRNLSEMEQRRVGKAYGGAASFNRNFAATAHLVSEAMQLETAGELMSIIEILEAKVSGNRKKSINCCLYLAQRKPMALEI